MIISHKHKFIFIKTAKTAGTSIEIALSKICGKEDIITQIDKKDEKYRKQLGFREAQNYNYSLSQYSKFDILQAIYHRKKMFFWNHASAIEIKERIPPKIWNEYYKFCFERNPFDKAVSYYYWLTEMEGFPKMPISEFISEGIVSKVKGFELYTIDSIPVVDDIYKFEEMDEAINKINDIIKPNERIELPPKKTKSGTRKDKRSYKDILSKNDIDMLSIIFAREIRLLDYKF